MNIKKNLNNLRLLHFAFAFLAFVLLESFWSPSAISAPKLGAFELSSGVTIADHMGRSPEQLNFSDHYLTSQLPIAIQPKHIIESKAALKQNAKLLKKVKKDRTYSIGDLTFDPSDLLAVTETLTKAMADDNFELNEQFSAHQIAGRDNIGNVFYTGYYAPVIAVNASQTDEFPFPIYRYPKQYEGKLPARHEIDNGALKGKGLEIAYARNPLDIYFMQVQGSGYIEYPNGEQQLLSFDGSNKLSYRSIGQYMIRKGYTTEDKVSINSIRKYFRENPKMHKEILAANPSYVFFRRGKEEVRGAAQVPLTKLHSVAVDPRFIPFGSILLSKVPVANAKGEFMHHEYRLLYAQDTGGAIKGPGRVDIFSGVGYPGKSLAGDTHHYGALWLLLPKDAAARP